MIKKLSEMSLEELWKLFPIFLTEHQECCMGIDTGKFQIVKYQIGVLFFGLNYIYVQFSLT